MDTRQGYGEDFYITLSSKDSTNYFPGNNAGHFRVKLHERLKLQGLWKVALCEFHMSEKHDETLVCCSNLTSSYVFGGLLSRVLRLIRDKSKTFHEPYYIKVDATEYDMIEIYIRDASMNPVSFDGSESVCTLHFKQL